MPAYDHPIVDLLAEFRKPGIALQITRSVRREAVHVIAPTSAYRLILCVTPRPANARASYSEAWGPSRFEPLGDLTLLPPAHVLQIRGDRMRQVSVICHLTRRTVEQWLEHKIEWTDRRLESSLHLSNPHMRALMMRLAEEAHRPGLASDAVARFIAGQLGVEIARFCEGITEERVTGGLATWRLRLIDERIRNLASTPTVEELAALCSLSVRQLSRGFRASRGCSISEYCSQLRLEGAKRLLAGADTIKAIAFATGYASPSSFAQAFRLATGSAPREFRQRMRRATADAASASAVLPD